jgi:hypothetical protein
MGRVECVWRICWFLTTPQAATVMAVPGVMLVETMSRLDQFVKIHMPLLKCYESKTPLALSAIIVSAGIIAGNLAIQRRLSGNGISV